MAQSSNGVMPGEVYIVAAARTPIGALNGSLSQFTATDLGAFAIAAAVNGDVPKHAIDEVYMGNVCSTGLGQGPARQAALKSGIPNSADSTTVNKVCSSGMKAIHLGVMSICVGSASLVVAGGMESASNSPEYSQGRGENSVLVDGVLHDGLWDSWYNLSMSHCAESCAEELHLTRQEQDKHAVESAAKAIDAFQSGRLSWEMVPIQPPNPSKPLIIRDELPQRSDKTRLEKLPPLRPNGTVTAATASPLADAAAAVVLASGSAVTEHKLPVLGRILGWADAAVDPMKFPLAPASAIPKALKKAGLTVDQIDCWELNEAFSVSDLGNARLLGIDKAKVNIFGGAVSMGHALGASGARIVVTLLNALRVTGGRYGVAAICNGGGGASVIVIEAGPALKPAAVTSNGLKRSASSNSKVLGVKRPVDLVLPPGGTMLSPLVKAKERKLRSAAATAEAAKDKAENESQQREVAEPISHPVAASQLAETSAFASPFSLVPAGTFESSGELPSPAGNSSGNSMMQPQRQSSGLGRSTSRGLNRQPSRIGSFSGRDIEGQIVKLWMDALDPETAKHVNVDSDVFDLGGTSLQAMRIYAEIATEFDLTQDLLPMSFMLTSRTPKAAAAAVRAALKPSLLRTFSSGPTVEVFEWSDNTRPVSRNQQEMWTLETSVAAGSSSGASAYNVSVAFEITGEVDTKILKKCLHIIATRHEVLRSRLTVDVTGELRAMIKRVEEFSFPFRQEFNVEMMNAAVIDEASQPFDLEDGPLIRVVLFRDVANTLKERSSQRSVLVVTMHHAICDEWSMGIFFRELSLLYAAGIDRKKPRLPDITTQYADFALHQDSAIFQRKTRGAQLRWKERLQGAPPLIQLPFDRPRSDTPSFSGGCVWRTMPEELESSLKRVAAQLGVNMNSILLTAFKILLAVYSGQEEIVVGIATAGRFLPDLQLLIGCFINPMPIFTTITRGTTFADAAKATFAAVAQALDDSVVPFSELVQAVKDNQAARSAAEIGANPIFQVLFQYLPAPEAQLHLHNLTTQRYEIPDLGAAQLDLTLEVIGNKAKFIYASDLFNQSTVESMMDSYMQLLSSIVAQPTAPAYSYELLNAERKGEIGLLSHGESRPEFMQGPLVTEMFAGCAAAMPASSCLAWMDDKYNYGNIYQAARELADNAITAGVKKGTAVGIYMERCLELPITIMAVWLAGGIYAPLDPSFPESRIQIYIEDSKAAFIICKSQHIGDLEDMLEESASLKHRKKQIGLLDIENLLPNLPRPEMSSNSPAAPAGNNHRIEAVNGKLPKVEPDDIAYIIFTSGTTGRPKGVQCHHGGLRDLVNFQVDLCKAGPGEVLLLSTTINFDPHLAHLLTAMCSGAELVIAQPEGHTDPVYMANLVVKNGITVFECVPTLAEVYLPELERVAEEHSRQMPLKMWMMGGEELPFALLKTLQERLPWVRQFVNAYGPTEATIGAVTNVLPQSLSKVTLGYPDPNFCAYIVDPVTLKPLPVGAPGELLLSGPRVATGYVGQKELTAAKFIPNPCLHLHVVDDPSDLGEHIYSRCYRTGDLTAWCPDGTIAFLGRIDDQVKVSGVRIEIGEVQAIVEAAPGVTSARVVAMKPPEGGAKKLVAIVTPASANIAAVLEYCSANLLPAAIPLIQPVDTIKLLPSGKLDVGGIGVTIASAMTAMESMALDVTRSMMPPSPGQELNSQWYTGPKTDMEATVQQVWMEVLGSTDEISIDKDFFAAGGNSLKAGLVTSRLRARLGLARLPATVVYTSKTIQKMSAAITKIQDDSIRAAKLRKHVSPKKTQKRRETIAPRLRADDLNMQMLPSQKVVETKLPFWIYCVVQYIFLALAMVMVPVVWGALLAGLLALESVVGTWWLLPLWPVMQLCAIFLNIFLIVVLKWALVQKLKPGVYPVHGWMYLRWITMRALLQQASLTFFPLIRRTVLLPWVYWLMGADIEDPLDTVFDTMLINDFDLITIKKGARLYTDASVSGSFVTPAGVLGPKPVLVLSPTVIGQGCHLGHMANVTAGTTIPDFHNLKPHASPCHPGDAPVHGPLSDHPHFTPEEHMHWSVAQLCGTLANFMKSIIQLPVMIVTIIIIATIQGKDPLDLIDAAAPSVSGDASFVSTEFVGFALLFSILYQWLSRPIMAAGHLLTVLCWKWGVVGTLAAGDCVLESKRKLFGYTILRRLIEDDLWIVLQETFGGTPVMGYIYKLLGAKVGQQVFLGGLTIVEFDALQVGDFSSAASRSRVYCTDTDGVIVGVTVDKECTAGNCSVIYPGAALGFRAIIGNDTVISKDRRVPDNARVQGGIQYVVQRTDEMDYKLMEEGLGFPSVVKQSASEVQRVEISWWYIVFIALVLLIVAPITSLVLWVPLTFVAALTEQIYAYLLPVVYVVMVALGTVFTVTWLRIQMWACGIKKLWNQGNASVFDVRAQVQHGFFASSRASLDVFAGTPFMNWIYRALGFKVGKDAILMCRQPPEAALISIGDETVIEAGAYVNGHYMEFQHFIYKPVSIGKRCWLQSCARVMPSDIMQDGARILPTSTVLPGELLEYNMIWGGLPAEPILPTQLGRRLSGSSMHTKRYRRTNYHISSIPRFVAGPSLQSKPSGYLDTLASQTSINLNRQPSQK